MTYVRLSVPVERGTADAARRLREWVSTPGFADLCAGVKTLDVGTLERIHRAVAGLYHETQEMLEIATGDRYPIDEGPPVDYVFRWTRVGGGSGNYTVRWRPEDVAGARARASRELAQFVNADPAYVGVTLVDDDPLTLPAL